MPKMRKRKGSALLLVVMVFMVISVISTLMLVSLDNTTFQVNSYSVMMQASYLNQEAQEAAVAGLLDDADGNGSIVDSLKDKISANGDISPEGKNYTKKSVIEHVYKDKDGKTHYMGESTLDLSVVKARYNGADKWWAYVKIKTETFDTRNYGEGKKTTGNTNPKTKAEYDKLNKFNYEGSVLVLCQNPVVQVFNMSPEDLKKMEDNQNQP